MLLKGFVILKLTGMSKQKITINISRAECWQREREPIDQNAREYTRIWFGGGPEGAVTYCDVMETPDEIETMILNIIGF